MPSTDSEFSSTFILSFQNCEIQSVAGECLIYVLRDTAPGPQVPPVWHLHLEVDMDVVPEYVHSEELAPTDLAGILLVTVGQ